MSAFEPQPNPTADVNPSKESLAALAARPDDDAIVMVNLLKFRSPNGEDAYRRYGRVSGKEVAARGGGILYAGDSVGPSDWDRIALVYYPRRAAFLDMQQSAAYQGAIPDRTEGLEARLLFAFHSPNGTLSPDPAPEADENSIYVVNLLQYRGREGRESYQKYGAVASNLISDLGGEIVFYLKANQAMVADHAWEQFALVRYPSIEALQGMVGGDTWQKANKEHRESGLQATIAFPTRRIASRPPTAG